MFVSKRLRRLLAASIFGSLTATTYARDAHAWLFEEHAILSRFAAAPLPPAKQVALANAWQVLQSKLAGRSLSPSTTVHPLDRSESFVDLGTLVALAGDHSCSVLELEETLRLQGKPTEDDWLPALLRSASKTNREITYAKDANAVLDAWREANLELNQIDTAYLTRASDNSAHFLAQQVDDTTAPLSTAARFDRYLVRSIAPGPKANAVSTYLIYQMGAVAAAARANAAATTDVRDIWIVRAFLAEAFALHFLGDAFSSGHIAGTHGNEAERLGTHDYYCQHGLSSKLWTGSSYTAHGDAFMWLADLAMASAAASESLDLFADALTGAYVPAWVNEATAAASEFDVCHDHVTSLHAASLVRAEQDVRLRSTLMLTPEPAFADSEPPRFTNEIGAFVQLQGSARGTLNAYPTQEFNTAWAPRIGGSLEMGLGLGFSMSAVTNQSADGDIFLQGSFIGTAKERTIDDSNVAVAPRTGGGGRVRIPFYLIPGDAVLLSMFVLPVDSHKYEELMLRAAQGSKWWSFEHLHFAHPLAWQWVIGRDVGFYYFGATRKYSLAGSTFISTEPEYKGYQLELPVVEARTLSEYSGNFSGGARAQLGFALEFDQNHDIDRNRNLNSALAFLRLSLEGRRYVYRP